MTTTRNVLLLISLAAAGCGKAKGSASPPCPSSYLAFKDAASADAKTCSCAANPSGAVYGANIYTQDSSLCAAAVHVGAIPASGGSITVKSAAGCSSYQGTTSNGVTTSGWGSYPGSFFIVGKGDGTCASGASAAAPAPPPAPPPAPCPSNYLAFKDAASADAKTCTCAANPSGAVYGASIYTQDSSLCAAALHVGAIPASGGSITVKSAAGCSSYQGTTSNGVTTSGWGSYPGSFFIVGKGDGTCAGGAK